MIFHTLEVVLRENGQRCCVSGLKFPRELFETRSRLEPSVGCIPAKMGRALALSPIRMVCLPNIGHHKPTP